VINILLCAVWLRLTLRIALPQVANKAIVFWSQHPCSEEGTATVPQEMWRIKRGQGRNCQEVYLF